MRGLEGAGSAMPGDEEGREARSAFQLWLAEGVGDRGAGWVVNASYQKGTRVTHRGSNFRALQNHTSSASNEPGRLKDDYGGTVNWESYWEAIGPAKTIVQIAVRKRIQE